MAVSVNVGWSVIRTPKAAQTGHPGTKKVESIAAEPPRHAARKSTNGCYRDVLDNLVFF
jgi:hypothetical protein